MTTGMVLVGGLGDGDGGDDAGDDDELRRE